MKSNLLTRMSISLLLSSVFVQSYAKPPKITAQAAYEAAIKSADGNNADLKDKAKTQKIKLQNHKTNPKSFVCADDCKYLDKYVEQDRIDKKQKFKKEKLNEANYLRLANQGDATAQLNLIKLYLLQDEVEPSKAVKEKLIYWEKKASDNGVSQASHLLGMAYQYGGDGVEKDYQKAISYFEKAAQANNALAEQNLGRLYMNLNFFSNGKQPNDYKKARYWLEKSVTDGMPDFTIQAMLDEIDEATKKH